MSSRLIPLSIDNLDDLVKFALDIYENTDPDKYPDFKISNDINDKVKFTKFFMTFMRESHFVNYNIRQVYALADDDGNWIAAVGVRRYGHMPSWSISWLLSPRVGVKFIPTFREIIGELCKIHEEAGQNEFFVTYPTSREEAYSKIMLPFRENYYTFVECTVPAKTRSPYALIFELMGSTLHPHDMNLRRYILRRPNTDAPSEGGRAIRKGTA
jgi:hypothetical protein